MILLRNEAVTLAAFVQIFALSPGKREKKISDALAEFEVENTSASKKHFYLRKYLVEELKYVKNSYIEQILSDTFDCEIQIEGNEPKQYRCFCCGYKTLRKRGEYFICKVCFWEDDGNDDNEKYSSPNKMTLREGKRNFEVYQVCEKRLLEFADEERMLKYEK